MQKKVPDLTTPVPPVVLGNTYTTRPTTITALQWDGTEAQARELCDWADSYRGRGSTCYIPGQEDIPVGSTMDGGSPRYIVKRPAKIVIGTLEGNMDLMEGSWLIKGTEDEFYPCKDSVFQRKYQLISLAPLSSAPRIIWQGGEVIG